MQKWEGTYLVINSPIMSQWENLPILTWFLTGLSENIEFHVGQFYHRNGIGELKLK